MMFDNFAVMIITRGRVNNQDTLNTLIRSGYTGRVFLVIDSDDPQKEDYITKYGKVAVVITDKVKMAEKMDTMYNKPMYKCAVYARNKCFDFAKEKGFEYILMCDDDVDLLGLRYIETDTIKQKNLENADRLFYQIISYMKNTGIYAISPTHCGQYQGGIKTYHKGCNRNPYQFMFLDVNKAIYFRGIFNDDMIHSADIGVSGKVALSLTHFVHSSPSCCSNEGGMFQIYKDNVFGRNFYLTMAYPAINHIVWKHNTFAMRIGWMNMHPMIISDKWKK